MRQVERAVHHGQQHVVTGHCDSWEVQVQLLTVLDG